MCRLLCIGGRELNNVSDSSENVEISVIFESFENVGIIVI